jgi:hypothetical protein
MLRTVSGIPEERDHEGHVKCALNLFGEAL